MSQSSEIKCPHCGQWSKWAGRVDEKCVHCGGHLEPERYVFAAEKQIEDDKHRGSYLDIKESDETIVQIGKQFLNLLKWGSYFGAVLFFIMIAVMLVIFGLIAI